MWQRPRCAKLSEEPKISERCGDGTRHAPTTSYICGHTIMKLVGLGTSVVIMDDEIFSYGQEVGKRKNICQTNKWFALSFRWKTFDIALCPFYFPCKKAHCRNWKVVVFRHWYIRKRICLLYCRFLRENYIEARQLRGIHPICVLFLIFISSPVNNAFASSHVISSFFFCVFVSSEFLTEPWLVFIYPCLLWRWLAPSPAAPSVYLLSSRNPSFFLYWTR